MIHPAPSDQQLPPTSSSLNISYEIVASEALPAFDPLVTVKYRFLTAKQTWIFNWCIIKTLYALFPMYVTGFLLRFVVVFGPATVGRVLGPISFMLQIPIIFQVIFALRYEYVKVLLTTFEFWFLSMNAAVWTVAFVWYLQDTHALMLPSCLVDYANMLLIEAYFQNTTNVARTATASACFLFSLIIGVSLSTINETFSEELFKVNNHTLSCKDILVNTMATMITLVIRLSYRKLEAIKSAKQGSTWEQSIGYRCRTKLHVHHGHQQLTSVVPYSAIQSESARRITIERMDAKQLLQLRFIGVPTLFDSADTLCPGVSSCSLAAKPWVIRVLYFCGLVGGFASAAALQPAVQELPNGAAPSIALVGLGASAVFWIWFACHLQQRLLFRLCMSFDFLFLYFQLVTAHLCLCDILSWKWTHCCGVIGCFLWTQGILTADALTPVMKERLKWQTWFAAPLVLLNMVVRAVLFYLILLQDRWVFQNRLLFNSKVGVHQVEFWVVPFYCSREVTIFVWYIRILHRIWTRTSEHEFLMMLGNVEYNYASWKQNQRQRAAPPRICPRSSIQERQTTTSSSSAGQPKQLDALLQSVAPTTTAVQAFR